MPAGWPAAWVVGCGGRPPEGGVLGAQLAAEQTVSVITRVTS
jgi:hypothetical protein